MVYMTVHWDGGSGSHCRPWLATIFGSVEPKRWPDGKLFDGVGPPDDAHVLVLVRGA